VRKASAEEQRYGKCQPTKEVSKPFSEIWDVMGSMSTNGSAGGKMGRGMSSGSKKTQALQRQKFPAQDAWACWMPPAIKKTDGKPKTDKREERQSTVKRETCTARKSSRDFEGWSCWKRGRKAARPAPKNATLTNL